MMMALGQFVFSLPTLAYQELQRQTTWRHTATNRVGARPTRQYLGPGDDSVTLTGVLAREVTGSTVALDDVREMANSGEAWPLVDGQGYVHGQFVIESLATTHTLFFADGSARRIDFNLVLQRVDDERSGPGGNDGSPAAAGNVITFDE